MNRPCSQRYQMIAANVLIFLIVKNFKQSYLHKTVFVCLHDSPLSKKHSHDVNCGGTAVRLAASQIFAVLVLKPLGYSSVAFLTSGPTLSTSTSSP